MQWYCWLGSFIAYQLLGIMVLWLILKSDNNISLETRLIKDEFREFSQSYALMMLWPLALLGALLLKFAIFIHCKYKKWDIGRRMRRAGVTHPATKQ